MRNSDVFALDECVRRMRHACAGCSAGWPVHSPRTTRRSHWCAGSLWKRGCHACVISTVSSGTGSSNARTPLGPHRAAREMLGQRQDQVRCLQREDRRIRRRHDEQHLPREAARGERVVDRPADLPRRDTPMCGQRAKRSGVMSSSKIG